MFGDNVLDILDIVQNCPKCPKWVISEKPRKLRSSGFRKFGTRLAFTKIGIRADPDSSRRERLVAIASVALPKRECGRSLKPRRKRGVWECAQWSKGRGRLVGGRVGSQRSWGVCSGPTPRHHEAQKVEGLSKLGGAHNERQDIIWQKSGRPSEAGGGLGGSSLKWRSLVKK